MYPSFFFNDTATTEIYTLSLHDALPISITLQFTGGTTPQAWSVGAGQLPPGIGLSSGGVISGSPGATDRKSTRLNSSHQIISYAVFCLKKKKQPRCRALSL